MTKPALTGGLLIGLLMGVMAAPAMADCGSSYDEAKGVLDRAKQRALSGDKSLKAQSVGNEFQVAFKQLETQGCTAEMFQLFTYIQEEQKRYPAPVNHSP